MPTTIDQPLAAAAGAAPPPGRAVAVVGACGGAGATTVATAVAHAVRRAGHAGVLVDLDGGGGGVDVHVGIEDEPGARWPELGDVRGEISGAELAAALPRWRGTPVLSADRHRPRRLDAEVLVDVLRALARAHDVTVLDAGRGAAPSDVLARCSAVVLVVPADLRGVAGAIAALATLSDAGAGVAGTVVRGVRGGVHPVEVEDVLQVPTLCAVPDDRRLGRNAAAAPALGRRSTLGRLAHALGTGPVGARLGLDGPARLAPTPW
ncbi:secretion/DNA translocation related CpaE-like protein [Sediminihabitans luteus]|uniref:Secretion/DNA translocation related CpaE-like protein n=1 Tax=Sediminihabitans luteus TaxID=1138585 RepID=A0A2M9D025_9CELL|nr:septum site-determining protein Ssd [Sediminihabitans luteus]PJJ77556.1 secretion/DNA translocation related CpaE-like protein [Sediminihabitans luteus]GII98456.1 hypothetical protein Slu03_08340 [Sediminihabitans luteus]